MTHLRVVTEPADGASSSPLPAGSLTTPGGVVTGGCPKPAIVLPLVSAVPVRHDDDTPVMAAPPTDWFQLGLRLAMIAADRTPW